MLRDSEARVNRREETSAFTDALDAVVVTDFLMRQFDAAREWSRIEEVVNRVSAYSEGIGARARVQLLERLGGIATETRSDMPASMARALLNQCLRLLPGDVLASHPRQRFTKSEGRMFLEAVEVGRSLVYDGALYRHEMAIVYSGCDILCVLLGFAVRTRQRKLKAAVEDAFQTGADGARRGGMRLADQMISTALEQGRSGRVRLPNYSKEIFDAL